MPASVNAAGVVGVHEQAVEIFQRLRHLRALAFYFARTRDDAGELVALVGIRMHHGVIDIIQIYSEYDAAAIRLPSTVLEDRRPDPPLWSASGPPEDVIDTLLGLPDPVHPGVIGRPWSVGVG
jgi:hypothetical protein